MTKEPNPRPPGQASLEFEGTKRPGGGKLSRSETVTVRLDPHLRYLAELAARKQRRTLSSFIEWAIEQSLKQVHLRATPETDPFAQSIADEASQLWDVDHPDRFAKLALRYPDMLTHDEQILWKLVRENGYLWRGRYDAGQWTWTTDESSLIYERLRESWDAFVAVARGDAEKSLLPVWRRDEPRKPRDPMDEEIPF